MFHSLHLRSRFLWRCQRSLLVSAALPHPNQLIGMPLQFLLVPGSTFTAVCRAQAVQF